MSEGIFCIFLWSGMFYGRKEGEGGNKKLTYLLIFSCWMAGDEKRTRARRASRVVHQSQRIKVMVVVSTGYMKAAVNLRVEDEQEVQAAEEPFY